MDLQRTYFGRTCGMNINCCSVATNSRFNGNGGSMGRAQGVRVLLSNLKKNRNSLHQGYQEMFWSTFSLLKFSNYSLAFEV